MRVRVLGIISDPATRALLPKVIAHDQLLITADMAEGLALAESQPPDVAFVEIDLGEGAGLAMIHHLKAVTPSATVFALASPAHLETAANAVALGGAGLLMMPVGGDEILSAIAAVKARLAEQAIRADFEQASVLYSRAAGWMARVAELTDCPSRKSAAAQLIEILVEATGSEGAAVYLCGEKKASELLRVAASPSLERAPAFGQEPDILSFARRERLLVVPLAMRTLRAGHILLAVPPASIPPPSPADEPVAFEARPAPRRSRSFSSPAARIDGMVKLLATQATAAFAILGEREREHAGSAAIKDPSSSAYSFAYYVDVAGREIDKARRFGRRFAIATVGFDAGSNPPMSPPEIADQLLKAARDTDVLARVDEHEFHLLMPEADGLAAHACRRRVLARMSERGDKPAGMLVGIATFPHDGQDLAQLLRVARRRAEATRSSLVHRLRLDQTSLLDLLEVVAWTVEAPGEIMAPRPIELSVAEAVALATNAVAEALRGGATLIVVAHHEGLSLGAAVRASLGSTRENVTVHAIDVRASQGDDIEALSIIAEHGAYAFIGRLQGGTIRGFHAADPLLADVLAERLGRSAGLRIFA